VFVRAKARSKSGRRSISKSKGEGDLEGKVLTGWLRGRQNLNGFFNNLPVFFINDPILESFSWGWLELTFFGFALGVAGFFISVSAVVFVTAGFGSERGSAVMTLFSGSVATAVSVDAGGVALTEAPESLLGMTFL